MARDKSNCEILLLGFLTSAAHERISRDWSVGVGPPIQEKTHAIPTLEQLRWSQLGSTIHSGRKDLIREVDFRSAILNCPKNSNNYATK
jgi:hypothetical protein